MHYKGDQMKSYLCHQDDDDNENTDPRANDTTSGLERNLIQGVSVVSPSLAEANMGEADGAPGEESGKSRERDEPVEDNLTG